ncbi:MAG: SWIM zinc finger family protein [Chloroflexi bacterium]|nr:SWIM zinc finger family protein [Chloroflexota bacterium]
MPKRKRIEHDWDDEFDDDDDDHDEFDDAEDDDDDADFSYRGGWGGWFKRSTPRKVEGGIKARSGRGKFGETWWASQWVSLLDSFGWSNRLQRGRSYARGGQVLDIKIKEGVVHAQVQGSRPSPYKIHIKLTPLTDAQWDKAIAAMGAQALFAAKLLAGEMPQNIEDAFKAARVSLLPNSAREIEAECSCPDYANPCKHIAAVHYILGEQFDVDPFIIFQLRGRTRAQVLGALRASRTTTTPSRRAPAAGVEEVEPLAAQLENFWTLRAPLDEFRVSIAPPSVELALVKRLGAPAFWRGPHDFTDIMGEVYTAVTHVALEQM